MIVSTDITDDRIINGIRRIEERYVDEQGRVCFCSRTIGMDVQETDIHSMMQSHKAVIESNFADIDAMPPLLPDQPNVILGQGAPSFEAAEGQFYLDTDTFDLYVRSGGVW